MKKSHPENEFLKYLSSEEQEQFLDEVLIALARSKESGNFTIVDDCIEEWEEIAELNSIPNFKKNVWKRFNRLKEAGIIN